MNKPIYKHIVYHELLEILHTDHCPICYYTALSVHRYLSSLVAEGINDGRLEHELRHSAGFCNMHSWQFNELQDRLATSIIYSRLLKYGEEELKGARFSRPSPCPACVTQRNAEKMYLRSFADYLGDSEFREAFSTSAGLCRVHTQRLLPYLHRDATQLVRQVTLRHVHELQQQLGEYIRKCDYRSHHESMGPEGIAWERATRYQVGVRGITDR